MHVSEPGKLPVPGEMIGLHHDPHWLAYAALRRLVWNPEYQYLTLDKIVVGHEEMAALMRLKNPMTGAYAVSPDWSKNTHKLFGALVEEVDQPHCLKLLYHDSFYRRHEQDASQTGHQLTIWMAD